MVLVPVRCPHRQSTQVIKGSKTPAGIQRCGVVSRRTDVCMHTVHPGLHPVPSPVRRGTCTPKTGAIPGCRTPSS
jgi:hypothetical protein